ncbi:fimbrial protein [Burkholderia ubonensis]|uniref:fimbrial protein n=1 Tax=Burkholderia ubonensis TaxID=101571 RepID=UPI0012FCF8A5|nr:fimbrial protein [Burkholderia ubonensis]
MLTVPVNRNLTISGAADANPVGQQISSWGGTVTELAAFTVDTCRPLAEKSYAIPSQNEIAGLTHQSDGVSYPVYPTDIPGVGYVLAIKDPNASRWTAISNPQTQIYPGPGTGTGAISTLGVIAQVKIVATGRIKAGNYSVPKRKIATLQVTTAGGIVVTSVVPIYLDAFTLTATTRACSLTQGGTQTVRLPQTSIGTINKVGSGDGSASFSMGLQCDPGVSVYATMTDVSNPANMGNILSLDRESTATGVGIQLFKFGESTPIKFGPDSSAIGNSNQWYVDASSASPTLITIPFVAKYVKNGPNVVPGSVKAQSTITFSYQ